MMLTRPHVFSGYLVVSPSLWYDQNLVFKKIDQLKDHKKLSAFFAIGEAENGGYYPMVDDMKRFVSLLPKNIMHNSVVLLDENHDTVFPAALTKGLIYLLGINKK